MNTYTTKIEKKDEAGLKAFLSTKDVLFENMQYASFRAKGEGFVAVLYESGKFAASVPVLTSFNSLALSIQSVTTVAKVSFELFDLQGRRLTTEPKHGVYIRNGKKVVK